MHNKHKCKVHQGSKLNCFKIMMLWKTYYLSAQEILESVLHLWQKLPLRSSRDVGWVDVDFRRAAWLPSPRSFQAYSIAPLNAINQNQTVQKKNETTLVSWKKIMPFSKDVYNYVIEKFFHHQIQNCRKDAVSLSTE